MYNITHRRHICGMILINEEELFKHRTDVHLKEKHQCQSCNQIFESKDDDFEIPAIRIHAVWTIGRKF